MAGSIKGIIVEIGGDTSGLQKALSKVNSATSSLSKELRGINSLLKLDPKNTELVTQKQQVLSETIKDTENKLKLLHSTYDRAVEAEANGSKISEENWRNIQREIINTENKLKALKLEASNWTKAGKSIEEYGEKITKVSTRVENLGNKLTKVLTTSIVGTGVATVKSAMDFETAFTGVEKTVDATDEQLTELKQGIKDLTKEIPSSTTEISAVAEAAGQLGIQTDNVLSFSKAMIDLGNSTNLTADEAASQLAKFANITQMSQKDFDKLGSSIVDLGNNYATTEADIVNMAMRLAGAGHQVGMSQGQILGLATALSSVGIEAEMGGSAISKAMVKMQNAVEMGGSKLDVVLKKTGKTLRELELMSANDSKGFKELSDSIGMTSTEVKQLITAGTNLEDFASVSGMTAEQFKKAWKEDASGALTAFIKGLGNAQDKGESAITMLSEMGLTEVRLRDSLLRAANAGDLFNNAIETGTKAWDENTALTNEADKRYKTLESRFKKTLNKTNNLAINLGEKLTPSINKLLDKADKFIERLDGMSEEETKNVVKVGLMVAAFGPLVKIVGKVGTTAGSAVKGIGVFSQAIGVMRTGAKSGIAEVDNLAKGLSILTNPATIAATGITIATGVIIAQIKKAEQEVTNSLENVGNGATNFINGISSATSHLDSFNSTLFASSQEQEDLKKNMDEVQQGITDICKRAADERRGYTQEEITQLDEYFNKLRELKNREIEIQQSVANAISQQAITNAESFQGTLEEYKVQSQEWIKTAKEQKDATIKLIEEGTIEEVALLNQRYTTQEERQSEAYQKEYATIMEQKQSKIDAANEEVAKVSEVYTKGYLERGKQNESFYSTISEYNKKIEDENTRHEDMMKIAGETGIKNAEGLTLRQTEERKRHREKLKDIYKQMYKDMDESQAEQLGVWLAQVSQTELYGGKIDEETQKIVDSVVDSYNTMPNETKKVIKSTMEGMLKGMEDEEPSLFAKATGIANGILSKLRKAFDIHSPSKKTRKIFNFAMKGAEVGIEDEENALYKKIKNISTTVLDKFKQLGNDIQMGAINQSVIDNTKTVFTTPQIVFNVQELDEAKLNQCFNYINRKFGSKY